MNAPDVLRALRAYVVRELLDGEEKGLDGQTPLIAWGLIDSISILKLTEFIAADLHVKLGAQDLTADNFRCLDALTALVISKEQR